MAETPKFSDEISKALEWWKKIYKRELPKIISLSVANPDHDDTPAFFQSSSKTIFLQPRFWGASHYSVQIWCLFHELAHYLLGHGHEARKAVRNEKEVAAIEKGNQAFRRYFSNNPEFLAHLENAMSSIGEMKNTDFYKEEG